jgi:CBS domain-containing protein/guanyl-specific ribonuclease Sa
MKRAYDIMTDTVASVSPQTPVSQVASMMRDLNIGDVLVLENQKLRGIVTDRDLTINVLTNGAKSDAPIEHYMTTDVVTGQADWSLEKVAQVMGDYQIRRLPIVENDHVVGIVSLGDLALHLPKRETVAASLKNISEVTRTNFKTATPLTKFVSIAIPVALGAGVLLVVGNSQSGKRVRHQLETGELGDQARAIVLAAMVALQDPKTRQAALDALESTGLPSKTRKLIQDSTRTLQDPKTRQAAFDALEATGLPKRTRQFVQDSAQTLQDPKTRQAAMDKLQETGLPDKTRQLLEESTRVLQDAQARATTATRERVMQFAGDAQQQARHMTKQVHLPTQVTRRLQKQKPKRFLFA